MVFPTFFNLSLNLAIRSSWSEPQSAPDLVFADYITLRHLCLQKYNQSDFGIDHLVMPMCRHGHLVLLQEGVCYDQCILLAKLCFDLLSMAPPIRTRPSFPLSQSLPSGNFHKPLILPYQRADRMKTIIKGIKHCRIKLTGYSITWREL